jgi:PPOX class probable F420-dependent enzyme
MSGLPAGRYVALTTYRRTGTPVTTPVWCALDGEARLVWTNPGAGKVKRIRHTADVLLADCDARGRVRGPHVRGTATLLPADAWPRLDAAMADRYGWQYRLSRLGSSLAARRAGRRGPLGVGIEVRPADPAPEGAEVSPPRS